MKLLLATMMAAPPSALRAHSKRLVAGAMRRDFNTWHNDFAGPRLVTSTYALIRATLDSDQILQKRHV